MPQRRKFGKKEIKRQSQRERAKIILQKGQNTAVLKKKRQPILVPADQFSTKFKPEDVEIPLEKHMETEEEENETEQNMEESRNDITDLEDEDRQMSPLKRTEKQMRKWHRFSRVVRRNNRPNKGIKPRRFRDV